MADLKQKPNSEVMILTKWFCQNQLSLSQYVKKTKVMLYGTHQKLARLHGFRLGCDIERIDEFEYLARVMVDPLLSFSIHIRYIQSKTVAKIRVLGRAKSFLNQDLYLSLPVQYPDPPSV